jgi:hypothetical protein
METTAHGWKIFCALTPILIRVPSQQTREVLARITTARPVCM